MAKQIILNLSGKVTSAVDGQLYNLKSNTAGFGFRRYKTVGNVYVSDKKIGSESVIDVNITSDLAAAEPSPANGDWVDVTGVNFSPDPPIAKIHFWGNVNDYRCGQPLP